MPAVHRVGSIEGLTEGKFQFKVPESPGIYPYVANLICDGYVGLDKRQEFRLKVVKDTSIPPHPRVKEIKEDEDDEDADDDLDEDDSLDEDEEEDEKLDAK